MQGGEVSVEDENDRVVEQGGMQHQEAHNSNFNWNEWAKSTYHVRNISQHFKAR